MTSGYSRLRVLLPGLFDGVQGWSSEQCFACGFRFHFLSDLFLGEATGPAVGVCFFRLLIAEGLLEIATDESPCRYEHIRRLFVVNALVLDIIDSTITIIETFFFREISYLDLTCSGTARSHCTQGTVSTQDPYLKSPAGIFEMKNSHLFNIAIEPKVVGK